MCGYRHSMVVCSPDLVAAVEEAEVLLAAVLFIEPPDVYVAGVATAS